MPTMICRECGEPIEPQIIRRIIAARRRGRRVPQICKTCFLQRHPLLPEKRLHRKVPLKVEEWECIGCGASLEPDEVNRIRAGEAIECEYCGSTISRELFT